MSAHEDAQADLPDYPWRAVVQQIEPDGSMLLGEADITRHLAVMYDAIIGSMDWGSGFLDIEDVEVLMEIAGLCGFQPGGDYPTGQNHLFVLFNDKQDLTDPTWANEVLTPGGRKWTGVFRLLGVGTATKVRVIHRPSRYGSPLKDEVLAEYVLPEPVDVPGGKIQRKLSFTLNLSSLSEVE